MTASNIPFADDPLAQALIGDDPMEREQPSMASPSTFDLDIIVKVLQGTIFSPMFCVFVPLLVYSQARNQSDPTFLGSSLWNHADRIYACQGSWLFAPPKLDWGEQIVLITGGGSGMGALLAETLAMRNVTVVVLTNTPQKVESENYSITSYVCDVSDPKQVSTVAAQIREEIGDPTVIVNNAGVVKGKLLLDLSDDDVRDTFGSNTLSHFWVLREFLPALIRNKRGHVVTMSSIMGLVGSAQMADYCASKAAVISLHSCLRFELDNRYKAPGIRTTLVIPSFVQTYMFSKTILPNSKLFNFLAPPVQPHEVVKRIIAAIDYDESQVIRLPFYSNLARFMGPAVGIVPKWGVDLLQRIAGADHAMRSYGPHPDAAERLISGEFVQSPTDQRERQKSPTPA
ncbi:hypothetical protein M231_03875 [Tremella mesenterica]|uniref:Short-chain dehydrogenase/reductase 3 n=1 Tax=Tremella mesenterica TaxID=5217 RepID=A0A4Q1BM79_TREME|nr:hypothetical protein M231_03875 [Tremella mesenterica]